MRVGILSDTHDNLPKIEKAVRFFNRQKVGLVLHAGDFVAPFAVERLQKLSCPWQGVFGNNDGEHDGLQKKSAGRIVSAPLVLDVKGTKIVLVHDLASIDAKAPDADIVISGHTHKPEIRKEGHTLFVNPGECGGWLTGRSTVALADLDLSAARIITV